MVAHGEQRILAGDEILGSKHGRTIRFAVVGPHRLHMDRRSDGRQMSFDFVGSIAKHDNGARQPGCRQAIESMIDQRLAADGTERFEWSGGTKAAALPRCNNDRGFDHY